MTSDPTKQYRMLLNTIEQAGYAKYDIKAEPTPPANKPTWVATVTVTAIAPVLSRSIYMGTFYTGYGASKSAANDAACKQMLDLFASYGIYPSTPKK